MFALFEEAGKFQAQAVGADAHRETVAARFISDRFETVAGGIVNCSHDDAGEHTARGIGNGAGKHGFLRMADCRREEKRAHNKEGSEKPRSDHLNSSCLYPTKSRAEFTLP